MTIPQIVKLLGVPLHRVYQRINRGEIELALDPVRNLYLFPDTLAKLKKLKAARVQAVLGCCPPCTREWNSQYCSRRYAIDPAYAEKCRV